MHIPRSRRLPNYVHCVSCTWDHPTTNFFLIPAKGVVCVVRRVNTTVVCSRCVQPCVSFSHYSEDVCRAACNGVAASYYFYAQPWPCLSVAPVDAVGVGKGSASTGLGWSCQSLGVAV